MNANPILPYAQELEEVAGSGLIALINARRGGDVLSLRHVDSDCELLWQSRSARDAIPSAGPLSHIRPSFYDEYPGGIQELFPNTAESTCVDGAELPFHGESCRIPWRIHPRDPGNNHDLTLSAQLNRYPVLMQRTISVDGDLPILRLESKIINLSSRPLKYSWAYHPALGEALLHGSSSLYLSRQEFVAHPTEFSKAQRWAPGSQVPLERAEDLWVHRFRQSREVGADLLYADGADGWFIARNDQTGLTVTASWDAKEMPRIWVWEECHDPTGYPWWGMEHVVGLELHSSAPAGELASLPVGDGLRVLEGLQTRQAFLKLAVTFTSPSATPVGVDASGLPVVEERY